MSFHEQHPYTRYDRLIEAYERLGLRKVELATTYLDTPIVAFSKDETEFPERPPVLIAAGAHAEEAAGVIAAWRIAERPGFPGRMLFVPCRDPLGWDGIERTLGRIIGEPELKIAGHEHAVGLFREHGDVVWDRNGMAIAIVGPLAFLSFAPDHPGNRDTGEYIQAYIPEQPELVDVLKGRTLLVPGSPAHAEGRSVYGWGGGPSVYVDETGRVGNFNRFFAAEKPPVEVAALRSFALEQRPDWIFDLHENFGDRFGMYTNSAFLSRGDDVYRAMIDTVIAKGFPIMPLAELMPYLNLPEQAIIELYPGVYSANPKRRLPPDAFGVYASSIGAVCFTTEMGMERPLAYRVDATEIAVRAGLKRIEERWRAGER